jgi:hypothetical protein
VSRRHRVFVAGIDPRLIGIAGSAPQFLVADAQGISFPDESYHASVRGAGGGNGIFGVQYRGLLSPLAFEGVLLTCICYETSYFLITLQITKYHGVIMAGENHQLSFKLPKSLKTDLKKLADADRRALSPYIVLALEKHVAEEKAKAKRK